MASAACLASALFVAPVTCTSTNFGGAFAVFHNLLCQGKQYVVQEILKISALGRSCCNGRIPGHAIGHDQAGIVGGHIAVNGDGIEGRVDGAAEGGAKNVGSTAASVMMKESMVAMLGMIMPAPLAIPATV